MSCTIPPYRSGVRYRAVPITLTRISPTITQHHQPGMRYQFALPQAWIGYYEVPLGKPNRFVEALRTHPAEYPLLVTFTAAHVIAATAELYFDYPHWMAPE